MSQLAVTRQRAKNWLREKGSRLHPPLGGMSRKDAARWASAQNMADLGEMVVAWLNGEVAQTPGHCGPPCAETIPLTPVLTVVNRAGFITDNSQQAGRSWTTWVLGFADDATMAALEAATQDSGLIFNACREPEHQCDGQPWGWPDCPSDDAKGFWAEACPAVAPWLRDAWWVYIEDPEPGRNSLLWPLLAEFAGQVTA